jgi:glycopeptide antibiotics resistance protein
VSLLLVFEIFYLSWLPNGHLGAETYLPSWLLAWSNDHFNVRTAVPFFALSFLLEVWHSINPTIGIIKKIPFWIINLTLATALVCTVELGQFFIARRHLDGIDVFFGCMGSVLGCFAHFIFNFFTVSIFIKNEK